MRSHESIIESVERTVPSARDSNALQTGRCDECGRQHACVKGEGRDKYVASSRDSSDPSIAVRLYNVNEWIHVQLQLCWATLLAIFCMNWVTHLVYLQICSSMSCRMGEGALLHARAKSRQPSNALNHPRLQRASWQGSSALSSRGNRPLVMPLVVGLHIYVYILYIYIHTHTHGEVSLPFAHKITASASPGKVVPLPSAR